MEVLSTSNLASSEIEKTTTACKFQTTAMNSFVMPHDLKRDGIGSYAYMQNEAIRSFMMAEPLESTLRSTYT